MWSCDWSTIRLSLTRRRRLRTQSGKFTCVRLGTKRLAPFVHSVLVIALGQTGLANLWPRCRRCRLFLITHLDAPRVSVVIRVIPRGRCASQRAHSPFVRFTLGSPSRVGQFSKKYSICSQDFWPFWDRFLIRNFRNSIRTPLVFDNKEWP